MGNAGDLRVNEWIRKSDIQPLDEMTESAKKIVEQPLPVPKPSKERFTYYFKKIQTPSVTIPNVIFFMFLHILMVTVTTGGSCFVPSIHCFTYLHFFVPVSFISSEVV